MSRKTTSTTATAVTAPSPSTSPASRQRLAQSAFEKLPFPSLKYGLDISAQPKPFDFDAIAHANNNEKTISRFETLENGVILADLASASKKYPFIAKNWSTLLSLENKFESFHIANVKNTLVIIIPADAQLVAPLPIPYASNTFEHIFIWAQKNSSVSLLHVEHDAVETTHSNYRSAAVEIFADENARVSYTSIQTLSPHAERISVKRSRVEKNASVEWYWAEFGAHFIKSDVSSALCGENASTKNVGVYFGDDAQLFDIDARVQHLAPHTQSELLARGVLDDSSKNVYKGLIKMTKDAKGSAGTQRADVLVLSPSAEADPVPILEIEGSDIRCSHAATVSRLDAFKLFYLTSRGLDEDAARSLYIHGFLDHLLSRFPTLNAIADSRVCVAKKLGSHSSDELFNHHSLEAHT